MAEVIYASFEGEANPNTPNDARAKELERLLAFIGFAQESTKLKGPAPASKVPHPELFALFEHEIQGLDGVHLDINTEENPDEIWLHVERRPETPPPALKAPVLEPWVTVAQHPHIEPVLRSAVQGRDLVEAGTHRSSRRHYLKNEGKLPEVDPQATITLNSYERAAEVNTAFKRYVDNYWNPWSELEKRTRKTIALYSELFKLKQALEGGLTNTPLELVWGVGLGIWNTAGNEINYPLLSHLVELSLNEKTGAIEIRPRDIEPRIELDWYAAQNNPGVAPATKAAKTTLATLQNTFSPFDRSTWEPVLQAAVHHLDAQGRFLGQPASPVDRVPPAATPQLRVTDTWVLFARARTQNLMLEDLERLRQAALNLHEVEEIPSAVRVVVTDPADEVTERTLESFRGIHGSPEQGMSRKPKDLFFPKPYNEEQVRIVQLLQAYDGVVVQGPPGTGKTHTIANIICQYLAEGKRVLVTSQKDPALGVLQAQLPKEIRSLVVSLLTSEAEGLKQFEAAIGKIASEVQNLNPGGLRVEIGRLESDLDSLHGRLIRVDRDVKRWATANLKPIEFDNEFIEPQDAAKQVVESDNRHQFLPDRLGISPEFEPRFSNSDVAELRDARRRLGPYIDYLDCRLPQLAEFPDLGDLVRAHQDLSRLATLTSQIQDGNIPALADTTAKGIEEAQWLRDKIVVLKNLRAKLSAMQNAWLQPMRKLLKSRGEEELSKDARRTRRGITFRASRTC